MPMWKLQKTEEFDRRVKWFIKKRPRELRAVLDNLDTIQTALSGGLKLAQINNFGFVHNEPMGILAIDQRGGSGGVRLAQTRLYIHPDTDECVIHQITIGDKASQSADIKFGREFVKSLRSQKEQENHGKETIHRRVEDDTRHS
jgi:hypothetical protein